MGEKETPAIRRLREKYGPKFSQLSVTERLKFLEKYRRLLPISVFEEHYQKRLDEWHGVNTAQHKN